MRHCIALILAFTLPCAAETLFSVTDLGSFGGTVSDGWSINAYGQVVGRSTNAQGVSNSFLSTGGASIQQLGSDGAALSINSGGVVVGQANGRATQWDTSGQHTMQSLGNISSANAINSAGHVAGNSETNSGGMHATLFRNSQISDLGHLGDDWSAAYGINDSDTVTGYGFANGMARAFLWTETGGMQQIGTLGGSQSWGMGINDSGEITGHATLASGYAHAFFFDTAMHDLGTLGGNSSYGYGINDRRMVVGYSYDTAGQQRAFLWCDGYLYDLNSLLIEGGWMLEAAYGINNAGQIVGTGRRGDTVSAFLLNPFAPSGDVPLGGAAAAVPEPNTAILSAFAIFGLTALSYLRRPH